MCIKGVICGIRVEDIEEPLMQEIRYLDKLIDELAKGEIFGKDKEVVRSEREVNLNFGATASNFLFSK